MAPMRHAGVFAAVALIGATLDLWTKTWACGGLEIPGHVSPGQEIIVIPQFFSIGHTRNPGIIFGLLPQAKLIFLIVSILAVPAIVAIFASVRKARWIPTLALGLILAGTLGNLYDRAVFEEVRDFIKFSYRDHIWPLFNLADSYILIGVLLLSIEMIFFDEKKKAGKDEGRDQKVQGTPGAGPVGGDRPAPAG